MTRTIVGYLLLAAIVFAMVFPIVRAVVRKRRRRRPPNRRLRIVDE